MDSKMIKTIYQEGGTLLGEADGKHWLVMDEKTFRLSDYLYEPCLYIKDPDGRMVTIHHSFTVSELCNAAQTNSSVMMISGNEYDIRGMLMLIRKAVELSRESVDISYVEGHCFMDYMKAYGALSPETAVDLAGAGLKNPNAMNTFIHSGKVGRTKGDLFYLKDPKKDGDGGRISRLISNQVRFGYDYRVLPGRRQYFAWHGYPNRNDDYITYAEISKMEFVQIEKEYPFQIEADRETAELFRKKYVEGHPVIKAGWNISI